MLITYKLNGKPACYDPDNSLIVGKPKPDPRPRGPFASCEDCPYISQGFICFSKEGDCMRTYMQNIREKNRKTSNEPRWGERIGWELAVSDFIKHDMINELGRQMRWLEQGREIVIYKVMLEVVLMDIGMEKRWWVKKDFYDGVRCVYSLDGQTIERFLVGLAQANGMEMK